MASSMPAAKRLCVGVVTAAHGIRGGVRVKSFTAEPGDIASYGPLSDESGVRRFVLAVRGASKGAVLAEIEGIADRDAAEALKGLRLYVGREQLPAPADDEEFYHADLIGLEAALPDGACLGTVVAVHDFGAGASLEILPAHGPSLLVPFTRAAVPAIDLAAGRLIIDPPAGLLDKPEPPAPLAAQIAAAEAADDGAGERP